MSIIKKEIVKMLIRSLVRRRSENKYVSIQPNGQFDKGFQPKWRAMASGAPFALFSILAIIFFILVGIYEVLFNSPLTDWIASSWNSIANISPQVIVDNTINQSVIPENLAQITIGDIANTSPQSLVNIPVQIPIADSFMQRTLGDWIGSFPVFFKQVFLLILSPLAAISGIVIVFIAIMVRLGRHIFRFISPSPEGAGFAKTLSWALLILSFAPLVIKHML